MSVSPMSTSSDEEGQSGYIDVPLWTAKGYPLDLFVEKNLTRRTQLFCGHRDPDGQQHILRDPIQMSCGHRVCKECFDDMKILDEKECKQCLKETDMDDFLDNTGPSIIYYDDWRNDRLAAREVDRLMVKCPYGCGKDNREVMRIRALQSHVAKCKQRKVECRECFEKMTYKEFKKHAKSECPKRRVVCIYNCGAELRAEDLETHSYYCTAKPNLCPFCQKGMYFGQEKHVEECKAKFPLGCQSEEPVLVRAHLTDTAYLNTHLHHLISTLTAIGGNMVREPIESRIQSSSDSVLEDPVRDRQITMGRLLKLAAHQAETKHHISNVVQAVSDEKEALRVCDPISKLLDIISGSIRPVQSLQECKDAVTALRGDTEILSGFLKRYEELNETVSQEEGATNDCIAENESKQRDQDERFTHQKALFEQYKWESHDGTFLWVVEEVENLRERCRVQGQEFTLSPPFYTEKFGYKMCVKLWVNGKGAGAGTHMSVELMLMKGDYDPILKWPFLYQVIFKLVDLRCSAHPQHHTWKSAVTQPKHYCSKQPQQTINDYGHGTDKFIDLQALLDSSKGFLQNHKMYLHTVVEPVVEPVPVPRGRNNNESEGSKLQQDSDGGPRP